METKETQQEEPAGERLLPAEASAPVTQGDRPEAAESSGQAARPIVAGIGASAGGLQALQAFFEALPEDLGVAFVVIVHLSPEHHSHMAEILAPCTPMPIQQVQDSLPLQGNHIYIIPPDRRLQISDSMVAAVPFEEPRGQRMPIDHFFRSLAEQHGDGFAVILSGGGSDGAVGVKAVKERGGLILVQEPQEAGYDSMPRAAIATGVADVVLPVRELAVRLGDLARSKRRVGQALNPESPAPLEGSGEQVLGRILAHLRARTGHDFSQYKRATVLRRLGRRMQLHRKETLGDYLVFLRHNAEEVQALFNDLLISVTTFFRDPDAFQGLWQQVIPRLFERADGHLRLWVPGCATGEEAYSLMILLLEEAERRSVWPEVQLFASDLDQSALARAREGRYPSAIEADVSPERLRRFFVKEGDHYQIVKEVRDRVIFAAHSLLRDPPFSRLDLISCRNLLIYLDRELQEQVFGVFHYALQPGGYLFLGISEVAEDRYFRPLDKKNHLYQAREVIGEAAPRLPDLILGSPRRRALTMPQRAMPEPAPTPALHQALLEALAPPSILVDEQRTALHFSETAGRFLQQPGGPATQDLTRLVRRELQAELRTALYRLFERGESTLSPFIPVQFNGTSRRVALLVQPRQGEGERLALVIFLEGGEVPAAEGFPAQLSPSREAEGHLQVELQRMQAQMDTMRLEYDATNEELLAANEELLSLNEEYQTTTEELETSKEELMSLNEELETVNTELKYKFDEVSRAHNDLENLVAATEIATLFLDLNLRIQRFTPRLADLFNVAPGDYGRPIGDFTHHLDYDRFEADARQVLENLGHIEREVQSQEGRWYLTRLRPYRTVDNRIDGVVLTFVDITERKQAEGEVQVARVYAESIIETLHEALLVLTPDLRVKSANLAFYEQFQVRPEQTEGRLIYELGNNQWDIPALRTLLEEILPDDNLFEEYEVSHNFEDLGERTMLLNGRRLDHVQLILLAIEDITKRKGTEEALRASEERLRVLIESVQDYALITLDPLGRVTSWNEGARRLKGYTAEEVIGQPIALFYTEEDVAKGQPAQQMERALTRGRSEDESWRVRKDGSRFWANQIMTPLRADDGTLLGFTKISRDLTERQRAEEELRRAHAELEERVQERTRELHEANAVLHTEITARKQAEMQLRQLGSRLTLAEQEERRRLSQILHDDLQQLLYGVQLTLEFVRDGLKSTEHEGLALHAGEAAAWLQDAIARTRQLTVDLSPPVLRGEGLTDALEWLVTQMAEVYNLRVKVEAEQSFLISEADMRVLLFQVIRELLFNVVKHAGTGEARVALHEEGGQLIIQVSDSGRGFEVAALGPGRENGFGLVNIRERLGLFGGRLEIAAQPDEGTQVTISMPLKPEPGQGGGG